MKTASNLSRLFLIVVLLTLIVPSLTTAQMDLLFHAVAWQPDHMYLGQAVCGLGDQNGDGYDDIAISVGSGPGIPKSVLIYNGGSPMDTLHDFEISNSLSIFSPTSLNNVGDLDGDGLDEIGICAWIDSEPSQILIYDVGEAPNNIPDIVVNAYGAWQQNYFQSISAAGDFNNDGYDDLLAAQTGCNDHRGRVSIYFGGADMDTIPDWVINGADPYNMLGFKINGGGDLNGDGFDDITVKEGYYPPDNMYVYFGGAEPDTFPDITFQNAYGWIINDLNGDGFDELIISYNDQIQASVYFGSAIMDTTCDLLLEAPSWLDGMSNIQSIGDCSGDGYGDVMVANPHNSLGGTVLVYFGSWDMDGDYDIDFSACTTIGGSLGKSGDVNNDGLDDIMWGADIPYGYVLIYAGDSLWAVSVKESPDLQLPTDFAKIKAYPNPFNSSVQIEIIMKGGNEVDVSIYDLTGRLVKRLYSSNRSSGDYLNLTWDGVDEEGFSVSSGIYFVSVKGKQTSLTKKIVMIY